VSALIRALVVLLLAAPALADGTSRVVLADADPELRRALEATLAPWRLEVIVDPQAPVDAPQVHADARFVVWRKNGELVVYDRERGDTQHRRTPDGPLDPASAAAAALTVKTLMRLPAPGTSDETAAAPAETTPSIDGGARPAAEASGLLRVQGALTSRMARGDDMIYGGRASFAVLVRLRESPLRFGVAGELGTASDIKGSSFRGTYSDWSVMGIGSWATPLGRWEVEPHVGAGVLRSKLDGEDAMMERHERETLLVMRAGVFARTRIGRISFGGVLALDAVPGTPTYTRAGSASQFFEVPPLALSIGVIIASDL
jgi:hypothetical protein